jgi:hypothetical protein
MGILPLEGVDGTALRVAQSSRNALTPAATMRRDCRNESGKDSESEASVCGAHELRQSSFRVRGLMLGESAHGPRPDLTGHAGANTATILSVPRAQTGQRSGSRPVSRRYSSCQHSAGPWGG